MSDSILEAVVLLGGCVVVVALIFAALWPMIRGEESECECPPTVLKNQSGGFTTKVYHLPLCYKWKKGTPK